MMKPFKFLTNYKPPFSPDVYEEMVLKMIHHCRLTATVPYGCEHPFVVSELSGINHRRLIIRDVRRVDFGITPSIYIEYDLNLEEYGEVITTTNFTMDIPVNEFDNIMDRL